MRALIPVAGGAPRLRPHTLLHPKALLPIAGKPVLAHILERLLSDGVEEVVFVVGEEGDLIQRFVKRHFKLQARFVHQKDPLGLGHAVFVAREAVPPEEPLLIVLGDTIFDADLRSVFRGPYSSLGIQEVEDPRNYGIVVLNERGFVEKLVEKPVRAISRLALVGIYFLRNTRLLFDCLEEVIQKNIRVAHQYQLTDALQLMIEKGEQITAFNVEGWYDCDSVENVLHTNHILLSTLPRPVTGETEDTILIPPVYIHPEAHVRQSVLGPNVSIGKATLVERCVLEHCIVGEHAHLLQVIAGHSLIGDHVKLKGPQKRINVGDYSELTLK